MTCRDFDRWLDAGMAGDEGRAHAASCLRCERLLAAARAVDELLATNVSARAPEGFTAAVMRRLATPEPKPVVRPLSPPTLIPLWVRAAMEPAAVLAMLLAGLLLWNLDWTGVAAAGARALGDSAAQWVSHARPNTRIGLQFAVVLFALVASLPLMRWAERFAGRLVRA